MLCSELMSYLNERKCKLNTLKVQVGTIMTIVTVISSDFNLLSFI